MALSGDVLYGAAIVGGSSNNGAIFSMKTDGTDFKTLHDFTGGSDGGWPGAAPFVQGNTLYGTTSYGGASGAGTVFKANTDGTGFYTLYHSSPTTELNGYGTNSDGAGPRSNLILSEKTLYGTAAYGGSSGYGTVFSIFIQPQLTLIPSGPYVILTWPTNYVGFNLQSTTNLSASAVWTTVSPVPVTIGEQNIVINTKSGTQQFYRLSQ